MADVDIHSFPTCAQFLWTASAAQRARVEVRVGRDFRLMEPRVEERAEVLARGLPDEVLELGPGRVAPPVRLRPPLEHPGEGVLADLPTKRVHGQDALVVDGRE